MLIRMQQQAEHVYSHSTIQPTRAPSSPHPLVALPPAARRPSCLILNPSNTTNNNNHFIDPGTEADTEKTPLPHPKRRKLDLQIQTSKKRRISQETFKLANTPSSHIPSPYLPTFKRYPDDHPKAAWDPKRMCSSFDSLEFWEGDDDRMERVNVVVCIDGGDDEGVVSPKRFYALDRGRSRMVDPTYYPPPQASVTGLAVLKRKRRKVVDRTYRDVPSPPASPMEQLSPISHVRVKDGRAKKRKRMTDPSYRATLASVTSSSSDDISSPRVKKRKVAGDGTLRPEGRSAEGELLVLKRRRGSVDLKCEFHEDAEGGDGVVVNGDNVKVGMGESLVGKGEVEESEESTK